MARTTTNRTAPTTPRRPQDARALGLASPIKFKSREERLQLAVDAMHRTKLSLRKAELLFGVPKSTLEGRVKGATRPAHIAHQSQQKLTPAQEKVLVAWVRHLSRRAIPLTRTSLRDTASAIAGEPIGINWIDRFMLRQKVDLKIKWTQGLEKCRAQSLNPAAVKGYFDELLRIITEFNIPLENIYNMDEKGVQLGVGGSVAAIVDRDLVTVYNLEEGSREHVTILEAACADGTMNPPSVVFQGQRLNLRWTADNPDGAR